MLTDPSTYRLTYALIDWRTYPFVRAQLAMELEVNADGSHPGPKYFASLEELEKDLAAVASTEDSKPISMSSVEVVEVAVKSATAAA